MKRLPFVTIVLSAVLAGMAVTSTASALNFGVTDVNITANGIVGPGEWADAEYEADGLGPSAGAVYAMWKNNYQTGDGSYTGTFQFLLHNIEQLTSQEDADYNAFDLFEANDPDTLKLTVWVFNDVDNPSGSDSDWLAPAGLSGAYTELDDRGFLVFNAALNTYSQWLPEDVGPEDGGFNWDTYWGVYAGGAFNNAAFSEGLPLAIDGQNEVYEVIYRSSAVYNDRFRRKVNDPGGLPTSPLINYFDAGSGDDGRGGMGMIPEPTSLLLFGSGLAGLGVIRRRRKRAALKTF